MALVVLFSFGTPATPPAWLETLRAGVAIPLIVWAAAVVGRVQSRGVLAGIVFMAWSVAATLTSGRLTLGLIFATATALSLLVLSAARSTRVGVFRTGLILFAAATIALNAWSLAEPGIGMDGNPRYFVGGKNAMAMSLLPLVFMLHWHWHPQHRLLRTSRWGLIGVAGASVLTAGSGTGAVMVLALGAFLVSGSRLGKRWWPWFLSVPVIHWALISGWLLEQSAWARRFVEFGLGKSADFTRRTYTWDLSWERILQNPLGEGRGYSFIAERSSEVSETHNLMLEAMVTGGWPAGLLLLLVVGAVMCAAARDGDRGGVYYVWIACLVGTMESYTFHFGFWLLLGLATAGRFTVKADASSSCSPKRPAEVSP